MSTAAETTRIDALLDEHAPIQAQRERRRRRLGRGERVSAAVLGGAFVAVTLPLAILLPSDRTPSTLLYLTLIGAYAAAGGLDFKSGAGFPCRPSSCWCRCSSRCRWARCHSALRRQS